MADNCFNMSVRVTDDECGISLECNGKNDSVFIKSFLIDKTLSDLIKQKLDDGVKQYKALLDARIKK